MNKKTFSLFIGLMILLLVIVGCGSDNGLEQLELNNNFSEGDDGWETGFADLPADHDDALYELDSGRRELPAGLGGYGIYLQGHNRSDDLFMYLTKQVTGLKPNTTYSLTFHIEMATNAAGGGVGIGGAPGESVFVKVGASTQQPMTEETADGFLMINIDKGNQATGGNDMLVIGDVASPDVLDETQFALKTFVVEGFEASTDADGNLWLIAGTDSGFEGLTTVYFTQIDVTLTATAGQ
jgi:hypothetical protein